MLAIGRALMGRPKLLLLDEPSMGLAPLLVEEVFNVVKALKAQGMSIILAEQNAFSALALADRGYVLETGSVTLTGTGRELIEDEQVRAAYLACNAPSAAQRDSPAGLRHHPDDECLRPAGRSPNPTRMTR
jgi:branched-chain amino acid transport system ATP-binding protein